MRTIIAGSRNIRLYSTIEAAINEAIKEHGFIITEIVSGLANGPDTFALEWAYRNGIPVKKFPADWKKHGKSARMIRNKEMLEYAEALIAIWDGESSGTKNMIKIAKKKYDKVYVKLAAMKGLI